MALPKKRLEVIGGLKEWDVDEKAFCITNLISIMDEMKPDDKIAMTFVTKEELRLMKASLDMYCNVGDRMDALEAKHDMHGKQLNDLKNLMDSGFQALIKEIRDGSPYKSYTTPQPGLGIQPQYTHTTAPVQQWGTSAGTVTYNQP